MTASNLHGTAFVIAGKGILVRGRSQSGKSSLCISTLRRAEMLGLPAALIADDRVDVALVGASLRMSAPERLKGLIEITGIGIVEEHAADGAQLDLVVDLTEREHMQRLPDEADGVVELLSRPTRRIRLPERDAAFCADLLLTYLRSF